MKKIVFIIPYFGKFPNYFQLFLNSCEKNLDYDWLILTDDKTKYNYSKNIRVIYTTFEKIKNKIQSKFDFKISLEKPYKLCDFKPCYGYIFEKEIEEYSHWGHCDVDLIFGKLNDFITEQMLNEYDKIFTLGHLTIYKNEHENNRLFMKKLNGEKIYKKYLSSPKGFQFDELYFDSINNIFEEYNKKIFTDYLCADIYTKSSNFKEILYYDKESKQSIVSKLEKNSFFVYENEKIKKYYTKNGQLREKEYIYIHLQKRKMELNENIFNLKTYKIIPNRFEKLEYKITEKNMYKIKKKYFNLHYFKIRTKNLIVKIKLKLRCIQ